MSTPTRAEVDALMKRCQVGVGGRHALDNAHSIMADCYGMLGALMLEVERRIMKMQDDTHSSPIEELLSEYAEEESDFSGDEGCEFAIKLAQRFAEYGPDSQLRCVVYKVLQLVDAQRQEIGQLRHDLARSGKLAEDRLQQMIADRKQHLAVKADRDMLRDALKELIEAAERGPVDADLWRRLEDAKQALAQAGGK